MRRGCAVRPAHPRRSAFSARSPRIRSAPVSLADTCIHTTPPAPRPIRVPSPRCAPHGTGTALRPPRTPRSTTRCTRSTCAPSGPCRATARARRTSASRRSRTAAGTAPSGSSYTGGSGWNSSAWQQSDSWQPSYTPQPSYSYAYAGQGADSPGCSRRAAEPDRDDAHPGGPAARSAPGVLTPGPDYFFLCWAPRFSRTRTEMWIGVPSNPNSSRSRRSMKRR